MEWEKIGEFGELWQYFTRQLFLLVILLATEVTKQLPFNSLNVSYSAYYSASLTAISLAHTDTERFTRSFNKVTPNQQDRFLHNESWYKQYRSWLTNHRRFIFTTRNVQTIIHALLSAFGMVTSNFRVPPNV